MIKIHGIEAYTTRESLPEAARLDNVLDNNSTAVKDVNGKNIPLSQIKKNFKPVDAGEVDALLKKQYVNKTTKQIIYYE
eukprot:UN10217